MNKGLAMARYAEEKFEEEDSYDIDQNWSGGATLLFIILSSTGLWAALGMGVISIR
jgi:hypothetical protein